MDIRDEQGKDAAGIRAVNELAFGTPNEADLVDAVRAAGGVTLSLVALRGNRVVGHLLLSPVRVTSPKGSFNALGLGPMAVLPEHQNLGIGSSLVRSALSRLREQGHAALVVLGHPDFYPRFGFRRASEWGLSFDQDAPDEAFMALELTPGSLSGKAGVVSYRPEFQSV